jgi:hypothetical protein
LEQVALRLSQSEGDHVINILKKLYLSPECRQQSLLGAALEGTSFSGKHLQAELSYNLSSFDFGQILSQRFDASIQRFYSIQNFNLAEPPHTKEERKHAEEEPGFDSGSGGCGGIFLAPRADDGGEVPTGG